MKRFPFIISALLVLAPAGLQAACPWATARPNVLMIIADDLSDWVGCLGGHPDVKTPNIDRLAKRGLLFLNAHCAAPVCNPSRVAALTGRRPSTTGIYNNGPIWHEVMPGIASIPQHFRASGYYTAGGGKVYHNKPGFNRRSDWNEYFDQVFADPLKQPFFLAAGIYRPHLPWYVPRKYFEMYPPETITPPPIKEDDLDDVPEAGRRMAEQRRGDLELVRRYSQYPRILQAYLASLTFCDAAESQGGGSACAPLRQVRRVLKMSVEETP